MLTLNISPHEQIIITDDRLRMTVRELYIRESSSFRSLRDHGIFSELSGVEFVVLGRFFSRRLGAKPEVKRAVIKFLQNYHAQQDVSFDCYAFANEVKGIKPHKVSHVLRFWDIEPKSGWLCSGSVIFLTSGRNQFHHAAVYLGGGFFISVYGAGGDLEISSLKDMRRDLKAESVLSAKPKK